MSKTIEFSDTDYAAIRDAASAEGMSLDAWVVANLPLEVAENRHARVVMPAKTMADRLAGRLGRIASVTGEPSSDTVATSFAEHLEAKQRAGRL